MPAALGWDGLNPDADRNRLIVLDSNANTNNRRRVLARMDNRSPFPLGPFVRANGDPLEGRKLELHCNERYVLTI